MNLGNSARPAPLGRLLAAMLYDTLPVLGIWMLSLLPLIIINGGEPVFGAMVQSLLFLELYGYFAFAWIRRRRTLGMLAWRLCIVGPEPQISLNQATLRYIGAGIGIACFGLGYLWRLFDREHRTWADLLSGTRIYYAPEFKG